MNNNSIKRKKIILILLIAVSVLGIVLSLNRYICEPWDIATTIDLPVIVKNTDEGSVVINGDARTIITLDSDNKITNKITLGVLNPNCFYFPCMALTDDACYFVVTDYYPKSPLLESQKIVKFDINGKPYETVFELKYDKNENRAFLSNILNVFEKDNDCYAIVKNKENTAIAVFNVSKPIDNTDITYDKKIDPQVSVSLAWYDDISGRVFVMDQFGTAYSWRFGESGNAEKTVEFESEAYYNALYANSVYTNATEKSENKTAPFFSDDRYNYLKHKPEEIKSIEGGSFRHEISVQLRIWFFWLGILVLSILILLFIGKSIHRLRVEERFPELKRIAMIAAIALVSMIIVIFYSRELISTTVEHSTATQRIVVQLVKDNTGSLIEQAQKELEENDNLSPETYNSILSAYRKSLIVAANENIGTAYYLSILSNDRLYPVLNTERTILSASMSRDKSEAEALNPDECYSYYNVSDIGGGYTASRVVYTDNSGNAIGTLYSYNDIVIATSDYLKTCADLFIKLFVGALVIVYAIMEIISWLRGFHRRRELLSQGIDFQGVALARPLVFLNIAVNAADSALIVLIVKDMLSSTEYGNNLVLCSLPMTVMALGFLFGGMFANSWLSKYGAKKVLLVSNITEIVFLIGEAWAVYNNNLVLLLVCMLLMTIFNEVGIYYSYGYAMSAPNDDMRRDCNIGNNAAQLSAYAVITIFSGYAAGFWGNHSVYIVALVPASISLTIILLNKFEDRNNAANESADVKNLKKERLKFLAAPQMLILIICGVIVSQLIGGYKSYVFPLFADQGGLSKASISNIQVFAKAIVFFSLPLINRFQKNLGDKNVIIVNNIILSAVFLMFIFNQSVIWSVVTLLFTYIANKSIDISWLSIGQRFAIDNNYNKRNAQSAMTDMNEFINIFKSPFLGWILGFGQIVSCVIIGIYLAASAFVLKLSGRTKNA